MLSVETLQAFQLANDMNAKLFFMIVIAVYCFFAYWKYERVEWTTLSNKMFKISLFIYSRVTIFFYPFMVVTFLHINTTLEEMIILVSGLYGIIFVGTFTLLFILGFEKVLDLLGIEKGGMYK
jgi:hypothetical protein